MLYCEICSDWMDCWNDCENCDVWREENGEDADKPECGKRAEMGAYDDAWIRGDDGFEMIMPPPSRFHDKFTAEIHSKIMHSLTPEQWKSLEQEVLKGVKDGQIHV